MLNIKQREEREALVAKREGLREELAFAVEHKKPWQWGSWESGEVHAAACEKHGDYQRISLTGKAYRGVPSLRTPIATPSTSTSFTGNNWRFPWRGDTSFI